MKPTCFGRMGPTQKMIPLGEGRAFDDELHFNTQVSGVSTFSRTTTLISLSCLHALGQHPVGRLQSQCILTCAAQQAHSRGLPQHFSAFDDRFYNGYTSEQLQSSDVMGMHRQSSLSTSHSFIFMLTSRPSRSLAGERYCWQRCGLSCLMCLFNTLKCP